MIKAALRNPLDGLCPSGLQVIRMVERTEFTHALTSVGLLLQGWWLVAFSLPQRDERGLGPRLEGRGMAARRLGLTLERRLRLSGGLPLPPSLRYGGLGLFHLARQGQTGRLHHLMLDVEQIRGMMRTERALHMADQPLALITGPLNDLDRQPFQGRCQRLRPGRRRAILGVLLQQNEVRHRLQAHQTHLRMKGFVFAHRDLAWRHPLGQGAALLLGQGDDRRFQRRIDRLLRAVGGAHERRQPAQLQKLAPHAHPRAGQQRDDQLCYHHLPLQPPDPVRGLDKGLQCGGHLPANCRGQAPILQRAARHSQLRRHLSLRVPGMQPRLGRRELFDPLQARAAPHRTDPSGGTEPMIRLQSNMVDASFIVSPLGCFALPRVDDGAASADALQPR